jgi:hypothetical protein
MGNMQNVIAKLGERSSPNAGQPKRVPPAYWLAEAARVADSLRQNEFARIKNDLEGLGEAAQPCAGQLFGL